MVEKNVSNIDQTWKYVMSIFTILWIALKNLRKYFSSTWNYFWFSKVAHVMDKWNEWSSDVCLCSLSFSSLTWTKPSPTKQNCKNDMLLQVYQTSGAKNTRKPFIVHFCKPCYSSMLPFSQLIYDFRLPLCSKGYC